MAADAAARQLAHQLNLRPFGPRGHCMHTAYVETICSQCCACHISRAWAEVTDTGAIGDLRHHGGLCPAAWNTCLAARRRRGE